MNHATNRATTVLTILLAMAPGVFADPGSASRPAEGAGLRLWTELSACKVFKDDLPPGKGEAVLRVSAARDEWESAQLVIRSDQAIEITAASVVALARADGKRLPADSVELLQVAYVHLPAHKKDYPDPLPPLKLPLSIEADTTQPIWVRVNVGPKVEPGDYVGRVELECADGTRRSVPLKVTVWPFSLPAKPSTRTAFGLSERWISTHHQVSPGSPELRTLMEAYFEELLKHRISAYAPPVNVMDPAARRFVEDERLTSFTIPYSDDEATLRKTIEHVRRNNWQDKGYFYVVDEPKSQQHYERLTAICRKIHAIDPDLKIVAPYFCDSEFGEKKTPYDLLAGLINIWCTNTGYFNAEALAARQKAGDEAWWYVCCGPREPHANFFIDMAGTSHRMLMWQQKKYDVEGLLYWAATHWNTASTKDPWTDMATVKDIDANLYGDGSLLYPGKKVGINGPVTSVRLEIIRDGLEDYECLTLYQKRFGAEKTQAIIARVVKSLTEFERDPRVVESVREELGRALSSQ